MKNIRTILFLKLYCIVITIFCMNLLIKTSKIANEKQPLNANNLEQVNICGRFPTSEHVTVDNLYWQVLEHSRGFLKLMNAYLDQRQSKSVVRINVNSVVIKETDTFHCQFWFDDKSPPMIVKATEVLLMWGELKFENHIENKIDFCI